MKYEQLERCYKTVLEQRNKAEDNAQDLSLRLDDAIIELALFKKQSYLNDCNLMYILENNNNILLPPSLKFTKEV